MGGLLLILPIAAFDIWLCVTTGRKYILEWVARRNWRALALALLAGIALAVWLGFILDYKASDKLRIQGFPVPVDFLHLDGKTWTSTPPPSPLPLLGVIANVLTGLAAPFIPCKVADFFKAVKAELK